jgi:hypothetical protein
VEKVINNGVQKMQRYLIWHKSPMIMGCNIRKQLLRERVEKKKRNYQAGNFVVANISLARFLGFCVNS